MLETHIKLFIRESDFLENFYLHQKWGKWGKNGPKRGIFEFIEKFGH